MEISGATAVATYPAAGREVAKRPGPGADSPDITDSVTPPSPHPGRKLSDRDQKRLTQLREQDREIRAHEQAHLAAAGSFATGAPTFKYVTGPDGQQYAISGEVNIDISEVPGDPEATARKMEQVQRAALAPMNPSAEDRQVAAEAAQKEAEALARARAMSAGSGDAGARRPGADQIAVRYRALADTDASPRLTLQA